MGLRYTCEQMSKPGTSVWVGVAAFCLCYGVPTLIEWKLLPMIGGFPGIVLFGNLMGCAIIAIVNRKLGLTLYAVLAALTFLVVRTNVVSSQLLILTDDIVPALIVAVFAPGILSRLVDSMGSYDSPV